LHFWNPINMDSHAYIIAGPNGAGKTTFAKEFLPSYVHCREFLNADLMAAGISPFDPDTAAMAAGRVLLARMNELVRQRKDFGFETTLAGKTYRSILRNMKERGCRLHLFYLWVPNVELAMDSWFLLDNSGFQPHEVARYEHGDINIFDIGFYNRILNIPFAQEGKRP
jgi:hypothetical protein